MMESSFDIRTLANMDVALERVCKKTPLGEQHETRVLVADAVLRCARRGKVSLGALTHAGARVLSRLSERPRKSA
jgi:hypothetical protein